MTPPLRARRSSGSRRPLPARSLYPERLTASSNVYRVLLDGLIVLDDVDTASGPYSWSPLKGERGKGGEPLGSWLSLPWGGPEQLILPGYHTAAETGLRKGQSNGEEVFLSVCGLMATGARTVLLSRWRTAGQTSFDLVREFAQELPNVPAAEAWQRSVRGGIRRTPGGRSRTAREGRGQRQTLCPRPIIRFSGPVICSSTRASCLPAPIRPAPALGHRKHNLPGRDPAARR